MRVGVVGAGGKMGQEVCRAVVGHPDLDLVTAIDPQHVGGDLAALIGREAGGLIVEAELQALVEARVDAIVDFTRVERGSITLAFCSANGIHAVVGTTGFGPEDLALLGQQFTGPPNCVLAANFAIGAVLMMRFAELAAPWFDGAEIVELHHDGKLDAPSGTAMATAARIDEARREIHDFAPDRTTTSIVDGARGASGPGGVRLHSVRLPGLVAHQEVIFGAVGQSLTLRHDSYDRASFMDGVVLALRSVGSWPGLTIGLEPLLGL